MRVRKAVITAAGRGPGVYPAADTVQRGMLPVIDVDGTAKPLIQIIAEEALSAGAESIGVVCAPGDEEQYRGQFDSLIRNRFGGNGKTPQSARPLDDLLQRLHFIVQEEPLGYGHAVSCARAFTDGEPFLLLLSDHLYLSSDPRRSCAAQIVELAEEQDCAVAGVKPTRESLIGNYGTLSGKHVSGLHNVFQIERILEKPSLSVAELELSTVGLRTGHYLCFFGMHVLTPEIFPILEEQFAKAETAFDRQLTPALQELARREKYLALEVRGYRYDIGRKFGLLQAQLARALAGPERDRVLAAVIEVMAETQDLLPSASTGIREAAA